MTQRFYLSLLSHLDVRKRLELDIDSNHMTPPCIYPLTGKCSSVAHLQNNTLAQPAQLQNVFLSTTTILIRDWAKEIWGEYV